MWRRLLALLGLARPKAPEPDTSNVIDFQWERMRRMRVVFVGYMTEPCKTPRRY
jgi:hypothetical protein